MLRRVTFTDAVSAPKGSILKRSFIWKVWHCLEPLYVILLHTTEGGDSRVTTHAFLLSLHSLYFVFSFCPFPLLHLYVSFPFDGKGCASRKIKMKVPKKNNGRTSEMCRMKDNLDMCLFCEGKRMKTCPNDFFLLNYSSWNLSEWDFVHVTWLILLYRCLCVVIKPLPMVCLQVVQISITASRSSISCSYTNLCVTNSHWVWLHFIQFDDHFSSLVDCFFSSVQKGRWMKPVSAKLWCLSGATCCRCLKRNLKCSGFFNARKMPLYLKVSHDGKEFSFIFYSLHNNAEIFV